MIYLITNRTLVEKEKYLYTLQECSYNGVLNIILREKDLDDYEFEKLYLEVKRIINPECNLIINSKIKIFEKYKEDILHLPFKEFLKYKKEVNENINIGVSVHTIEEAIEADRLGAHYILASHIYNTKCKLGLKPKGIGFISELRKKVNCNIVALGGINENNFRDVLRSGADSIALMSYFFNSKDIVYDINKLEYNG